MNAWLIGKDQYIVEMDQPIANLNEQINGLNLKFNEAKEVVIDAFTIRFIEAMRLAKHFFANGLNLKFNEGKEFVVDAFAIRFNEAMKLAKHFFTNKGLDFEVLNSSRFLEDMLSHDSQMVEPDQFQTTQEDQMAKLDQLQAT